MAAVAVAVAGIRIGIGIGIDIGIGIRVRVDIRLGVFINVAGAGVGVSVGVSVSISVGVSASVVTCDGASTKSRGHFASRVEFAWPSAHKPVVAVVGACMHACIVSSIHSAGFHRIACHDSMPSHRITPHRTASHHIPPHLLMLTMQNQSSSINCCKCLLL